MRRFTLFLIAIAVGLSGCDSKPAPRTAIAASDSGAPVPGMVHGNHNPKYGGVVLMNGDLHFEIVDDESGRYAVYFSDAARNELPASAVSNVHLTVERPKFRGEPVDMKISDTGERWEGIGGGVDDSDTDLRIDFDYQGKHCTSDMPFFAGKPEKARSASK
jgi:hypothetical protein